MKKKLFLIMVLCIVIITLCLWKILEPAQEPDNLDPKILRKDFPKYLVISGRKGVIKLQYEPSFHQYQKIAEIRNVVFRQLFGTDNTIFSYKDDTIYRIGKDFSVDASKKIEKISSYINEDENITTATDASKKMGKISSMAVNDKNIFIAVEEDFIILNKELEEVSRLSLKIERYLYKEIDSIIVHDNKAYLMDNLRFPIYLFCVDVANIKEPKIITTIFLMDVYVHPLNQWLNTEHEQWLFTYYSSKGTYNIHIHPDTKFNYENLINLEAFLLQLKNSSQKKDEKFFYLKKWLSKNLQQKIDLYDPKFRESKADFTEEFNHLLEIPSFQKYFCDELNISEEEKKELLGIKDTRLFLQKLYPEYINLSNFSYYPCDITDDKNRFADGKNYYILATTPISPNYAIILEREINDSSKERSKERKPQNTCLVKMDSKDNKINFLHILLLKDFYGFFWRPGMCFLSNHSIRYKNDYLFLATTVKLQMSEYQLTSREYPFSLEGLEAHFDLQGRNNLIKIIDVKNKPQVIFSKNIAEYGLDGIYDILVY